METRRALYRSFLARLLPHDGLCFDCLRSGLNPNFHSEMSSVLGWTERRWSTNLTKQLATDRGHVMHPKVLPLFTVALGVGFVLLVYALYQQQQQLNKLVILVDGVTIEQK